MLDEDRIKEAERNVKSYINEGLIFKKEFNPLIFRILLNNAEESLKVAKLLYEQNHSDFWAIVASYYSMYYSANAVLFKLGYKIGDKISHKVTAESLIVFVRHKLKASLLEGYYETKEIALAGIKADSLIESFDLERGKRGRLQYELTEEAKHSKAKTSFERAREFLAEMEKLIL